MVIENCDLLLPCTVTVICHNREHCCYQTATMHVYMCACRARRSTRAGLHMWPHMRGTRTFHIHQRKPEADLAGLVSIAGWVLVDTAAGPWPMATRTAAPDGGPGFEFFEGGRDWPQSWPNSREFQFPLAKHQSRDRGRTEGLHKGTNRSLGVRGIGLLKVAGRFAPRGGAYIRKLIARGLRWCSWRTVGGREGSPLPNAFLWC